ncbi:MAG: FtsX-like permease family protein [Oscillospiraceae bacterium]|nr:FtsX-like permease family protein [Oscillospiraceae bacterium]
MLLRKLWRTMGQYKAQFISMIIMIALGVGVFVGFNMEWYSIEKDTGYLFGETGFADYRIISESGFTDAELDKISEISGVEDASRFLSVNADIKGTDNALALTVTENEAVSGMYLISGDKYDKDSTDGIWLSDKYADANAISVGDEMILTYRGMEIVGKVKGFVKSSEYLICVRDESQLMPDYNTFGFAFVSPVLYENATGMAFYPQIHVISEMGKADFTAAADKALGKTSLILTKDEVISYAQAEGEATEGKTMGSVLPVLFLLIAVLTMITTMHRLTAKEKTQIGTLKALGFKDKRITRHYTAYALMIGLIGSVIGIGLGFFVAWFIMNPNGSMGTYFDMPQWKLYLPWFCVLILVGIVAVLTLIGYLSVKKMLRGNAADALRSDTPAKMKNLLLEKTSWFHKLSFGTRWNLRDIMRHKSRTAMSLLGVFGCMMIIVCALGMKDTMDAFLDLSYDGTMNYTSRIYLSEDATPEQRNDIVEKYSGDTGATIGVQLGDKAVALDIFDAEHDKVRFLDKDNRFIPIGDDGAYICMRVADKNNLSVGDSFTVSPYGSDDTYTLKVAGITRSSSENIVISPAYAKSVGISYAIDSVYTDVNKTDIADDAAIKSVQSKQMIMDSFDTFLEIMNLMISILILAAVILGIVVLYNLGVMSYTERYREMATLKVVGFKDKKIQGLLVSQNLWVTVFGMLIGLPLGIVVLNYLLTALAPEYEMKITLGVLTYSLSILLTFGVSMIVSLMVARKNRKIDMVEALKDAE